MNYFTYEEIEVLRGLSNMTKDSQPGDRCESKSYAFNHYPSCASSPASQYHTFPAKKPIPEEKLRHRNWS